MKKAFRMLMMITTALVVIPIAGNASGKLSLKCQNSLPDQYAASMALAKFAEQVKEKTNGDIEITVFPTGQLFKDTDLPTALPTGAINLALPNLGQWAGLVPSIAAMSLVGPYESAESFYRMQEGELGKLWADDLKKKANVHVLSYMSLGAADIITSPKKFIKTAEDFKGLKLQCATKGMQIFGEALGAVPTSISASDIYTALQKGVIDACGSAALSVQSRKWYEVSPYQTKIVMNPEGPFALLINLDLWNKIPAGHQKVMEQCAKEAWLWNRAKVQETSEDAWNTLKSQKNVQVYEVPEDLRRQWAKSAEQANRQYLEKTVGKEQSDLIFQIIQKAQ